MLGGACVSPTSYPGSLLLAGGETLGNAGHVAPRFN